MALTDSLWWIHGPWRRVRDDQNGEDTRTSAERSYTSQLRAQGYSSVTAQHNNCPSRVLSTTGCLGCWRDRPFLKPHLFFDESVPMWMQEAIRPDSDEDCIHIGEFPCYRHYGERLVKLEQVPVFKVLVWPGWDSNQAELRPTRHERSALTTRPYVR